MSDTKDSMPAQPATKQLPAMTDRALLEDLRGIVKEGFTNQNQVIAEMNTSVDMLIGQGKTFAKWRGEVDAWREEVDERLKTGSLRAKEPSKHDIEIRAELQAEKDAREALAKKVEGVETSLTTNTDATLAIKKKIVDGVESFWKRHPKIETALVALIIAAAGVAYTALTHGGHLP